MFKETAHSAILCLFELVVGILLLINPIAFTSGIIAVAGVVLMVVGLWAMIKYFRMDVKTASLSQLLAQGLAAMLAGSFCAFRSDWFIATFPVLAILYGVAILLTGLSKIQTTVDMLRRKNKKWFWAAINAAVSILCAVIILSNPFGTTAVLWLFTGISLIVEAVLDLLTIITGRKSYEDSVL